MLILKGTDNQCNGHESCLVDDVCQCYDSWGVGLGAIFGESGDCSDRVCPFEIAWVDSPNSEGRRHTYVESMKKANMMLLSFEVLILHQ